MAGKQEILRSIQATAEQLGGVTPGRAKFVELSGISEYEIGSYWPRWSDAVVEAGLVPKQFVTMKYTDDELLELLANLTRRLGHFPVNNELRIERSLDAQFPNQKVIHNRFGAKRTLVSKLATYVEQSEEWEDVKVILNTMVNESVTGIQDDIEFETFSVGYVYLIKMDKWHKIGKTNDILRRTGEIRLTLPEQETLVHTIATVDPSGIESYWHRRFDSRRRNGEWFLLSATDVKEFRKWRKIS